MCGIIAGRQAGGINRALLSGLARLEYRGYDSAGIAVGGGGKITRIAVVGRVAKLRQKAARSGGDIGIAHTRWATHGAPSDANAHPIRAGDVYIVHNGIIENHDELRAELRAAGCKFRGETDSETAAHLLNVQLAECGDLLRALQKTRRRLRGAYALVAVAGGRDEVVCARQGSPLLAAEAGGGVFFASDAQALPAGARRAHYLADGETARIAGGALTLCGADDKPRAPDWRDAPARVAVSLPGEYRHFMQKEIFEQPDAVAATMEAFVGGDSLPLRRFGAGAAARFRRRQIVLVACGTSYHAAQIARRQMARFGVPCRAEIASEYRAMPDPQAAQSLCIAVSQSGETADTLAAMRAAKAAGAATLALVNTEMSALAREADAVFYTRAGVEIGVASTKAFTAQLTALLLLTLAAAKARRRLPPAAEARHIRALRRLPHYLRKALLLEDGVKAWAAKLAAAQNAVFIGRGEHYPVALEGALKLKEISYIHAEGIAAGELKHGSLALADETLPVIGIAPDNALAGKMTANLAEAAARGARLFVLAGAGFSLAGAEVLRLADDGGEWLSPLVYSAPLQLLAYHTARQKGTDIDKPRNLAKSVTVE